METLVYRTQNGGENADIRFSACYHNRRYMLFPQDFAETPMLPRRIDAFAEDTGGWDIAR
ncbi:hypothetical protein ASD46_21295 [Rhizobium sp. Root491]|nr:hypothetical protein ASD46_21295 [Rhizobium sp. Root491]